MAFLATLSAQSAARSCYPYIPTGQLLIVGGSAQNSSLRES